MGLVRPQIAISRYKRQNLHGSRVRLEWEKRCNAAKFSTSPPLADSEP